VDQNHGFSIAGTEVGIGKLDAVGQQGLVHPAIECIQIDARIGRCPHPVGARQGGGQADHGDGGALHAATLLCRRFFSNPLILFKPGDFEHCRG